MAKTPNKRDCPQCGTRMDYKGRTEDTNDEGQGWTLWQCQKCKNVETLWEG